MILSEKELEAIGHWSEADYRRFPDLFRRVFPSLKKKFFPYVKNQTLFRAITISDKYFLKLLENRPFSLPKQNFDYVSWSKNIERAKNFMMDWD